MSPRSTKSPDDSTALLARLRAALATRYPALLARLGKGASATEVAALERTVGRPLPAAFRAFLRWRSGNGVRALDGLAWLSATDIGTLKTMMDEIVDEGHYADYEPDQWWSKGWVPFADDRSGYRSLVLDLHGSFGGAPGQVLSVAAKDSTRARLAPSFEAWLGGLVAVVEAGALQPDDGGWYFGDEADRALPRALRGYRKIFEPAPLQAPVEEGSALQRPTRPTEADGWPDGVPRDGSVRWLLRASGERVDHWLVAAGKTSVREWSGRDPSALRSKSTRGNAAKAHDERLRKQLSAGFCFVRPLDEAAPGQVVFAMHVGDGSNSELLDLAPDGRTLAVATMLGNAMGAHLYLVDIVTGRRTRLHTDEPGEPHGQTFVHRVMFGPGGEHLYYQLNGQLRRIATAGGEPELVADIEGGSRRGKEPLFNPHVSQPQLDAKRERLLCFDHQGVAVRSTAGGGGRKGKAGAVLFRLKVRKGKTEYRWAAISPSGRLLALVHQSRHVVYGHEDARGDRTNQIEVWSVDEGKLVATIPLPGTDENVRRVSISPDDAQVLLGTYRDLTAFAIATGRKAWSVKEREWAHSPDGTCLAVASRGGRPRLLRAKTRRVLREMDSTSLWAQPYAEVQTVQALGWSDDGTLVVEGGGSGRVYVWKA